MKNFNNVKLGGYMEYQGGTLDRLWSTTDAAHATHPTPGGKDMQMWWNFSTTPHYAKIISSRVIHQGCQRTVTRNKKYWTTNPFNDWRKPITGH